MEDEGRNRSGDEIEGGGWIDCAVGHGKESGANAGGARNSGGERATK